MGNASANKRALAPMTTLITKMVRIELYLFASYALLVAWRTAYKKIYPPRNLLRPGHH
jgi:hypothetical protein